MEIKLGSIISPAAHVARDAVHVAIHPAVAGDYIDRGSPVGLTESGMAIPVRIDSRECVGVADPFLDEEISEGERFWIFLKPGTVKNLRHNWDHPAITEDGEMRGAISDNDDGCRGCD